jgi:hypothetical protein
MEKYNQTAEGMLDIPQPKYFVTKHQTTWYSNFLFVV